MSIDSRAADMLSKGFYKERLEPSECEYLLTFRDRSPVANLAISLADRLTRAECGDTGQICAEIDVSTGPCPCNCRFCSYAEGVTSARFFEIEDSVLIRYVQELNAFSDVRRISLMTIGDTDIDELARRVGIVKDTAKRGTQIYVNTRDVTSDECRILKKAGTYGAYHSCRIGEGTDTEIKEEKRLETIDNLVSAGLSVIAGTGPIGPEHSPKELTDAFFKTADRRCCGADIYAREPVAGTKFNSIGKMSPSRMSQIRAVFTLATSRYDFPINEPFRGTFVQGHNVSYAKYDSVKGKDQLYAARRRLFNNGYQRVMRADSGTNDLTLAYLRQTGSV